MPVFLQTACHNFSVFIIIHFIVFANLSYHFTRISRLSHWHKDLEFILIKKGPTTYNDRLID